MKLFASILVALVSIIVPFTSQAEGLNTVNPRIKIWSYHGGEPLNFYRFYETVLNVQSRISVLPHNANMAYMVMETVATESYFGSAVRQHNNGPARGIIQMEPATEADMLSFLSKYKKQTYKELMVFYRPEYSKEWNRTNNVPYQIAISSLLYWRMSRGNLEDRIMTRESRARFWKEVYNTSEGKGSQIAYIEKCRQYL